MSTDGGLTFSDIDDGPDYTGTLSAALTVLSVDVSKNGNVYRAVLDNESYVCGTLISDSAVLTVGPATMISNRRITFRVDPN